MTLVGTLVEDAYKAITIPRNVGAALRELLTAQFEALYRQHSQERDQAQRDKAKLLDQRRALMQAHYAGAIPIDLLREEQEAITRHRDDIDAFTSSITRGLNIDSLVAPTGAAIAEQCQEAEDRGSNAVGGASESCQNWLWRTSAG